MSEQRIDREQIVDHDAIADRTCAAGVVRRHAAERRPAAGRDVDRKEQAVRPQMPVEAVEHDARLDPDRAGLGVQLDDLAQILGVVDDQALADGLPGLGGAAAARGHRDAELAPERERRLHVGIGLRHDHRERLDLIDRGVGAVAAAIERIEQHLACDLALQAPGQRGIAAAGIQPTALGSHTHRRGRPLIARVALNAIPPRLALSGLSTHA